jgi:peroxiredoxin
VVLAFGCAKSENPVVRRAAHPLKSAKPAPQKKAPEPGETNVGSMMPPYHAKYIDGKEFDLASQKGSVVLLNLWATWCQPCRFEIPELEKMHNELSPRGLKIIGVSLDDSGVDGVKQFVKEQKMTYTIAIDPEGTIANIFQTSIIPTTVLIDKTGKIVWKEYGPVSSNDESLKKALDAALKS